MLLKDTSALNEIQQLTLVKDSLRLSNGGGFVTLKDTSATNEIQTLSLAGTTLSLSKGGGNVSLPAGGSYQAGTGIYINGNTINALDENDTNELQGLSLSGRPVELVAGGGSVTLPDSYWEPSSNNSIINTNSGGVKINYTNSGGLVALDVRNEVDGYAGYFVGPIMGMLLELLAVMEC